MCTHTHSSFFLVLQTAAPTGGLSVTPTHACICLYYVFACIYIYIYT